MAYLSTKCKTKFITDFFVLELNLRKGNESFFPHVKEIDLMWSEITFLGKKNFWWKKESKRHAECLMISMHL